ncbi:uncharacterized protein LOC117117905 isoform X2 [Anneissia japonica]|uniref:uncharacterized protein LOC117117905 isoform X2 n=1 Tax=Anneissia japonica TaxID=1529436 RepID=UPI001425B959|nr:uncharacterized protein LOC117117905 isoform X2 [Anneissia japonica]
MVPETTPTFSVTKGFSDVYKMWITFGIVASVCLIIMVIIVIIRGSRTVTGSNAGVANRPLPVPEPDPYYYEDLYDKIETYHTHITSSGERTNDNHNGGSADQQLGIQEQSGYLIADNSTDVSANNPEFVDDYATKVNHGHHQFGIRDEFGYLVVDSSTANNLATDVVANSANNPEFVDDYATKVNLGHHQLGIRDEFGYLIVDNSTTNILATDVLTNSADNPVFVDDYTTKITSNEDVINSTDDFPTMVDSQSHGDGLNSENADGTPRSFLTITTDGDVTNSADNPVFVDD